MQNPLADSSGRLYTEPGIRAPLGGPNSVPNALVVGVGRVLSAMPALQVYEVNTGVFAGVRRCTPASPQTDMGVGGSVGYAVGAMVVIAIDPKQPNAGIILGGFSQLVGYDFLPAKRRAVEAAHVGRDNGAYNSLQDLATITPGQRRQRTNYGFYERADASAGDWHILNQLANGGVGVETFCSWIAGSELCGAHFYADEQLARFVGFNRQDITAGAEDDDRAIGDFTELIRRRVHFVSEAYGERGPRELELVGHIHAGRQRFYTYMDEDAHPYEGGVPTQRQALFHEYVDINGGWSVSSASSILLQKYVGIPVPIEDLEGKPDREDLAAEVCADDNGEEVAQAISEDENPVRPRRGGNRAGGSSACDVRDFMLRNRRPTLIKPVDGIVLAMQSIEAKINWYARAGVDTMHSDWRAGKLRDDLAGTNFQHGWQPGAWDCLPRTLGVRLSVRDKHRVYLSRSIITITDDGSIMLQDAYGSSISMSNGCVTIQAPKHVTVIAGEDAYMLGGNNAGVQGRNAVEVVSAEGELKLESPNTATLIRSAGMKTETVRASASSTADGGDAFVIQSTGRLALQGTSVYVQAYTNDIVLDSQGPVVWRGGEGYGTLASSVTVAANNGEDYAVLGAELSYLPHLSAKHLRYHRLQYENSNTQTKDWVDDYMTNFDEHVTRVVDEAIAGLFEQAPFVDSDPGVEDEEEAEGDPNQADNQIPEPVWLTFQRMNAESTGADTTSEDDVPEDFPLGQPTKWRLRRLGAAGALSGGYIDYATGTLRSAGEPAKQESVEDCTDSPSRLIKDCSYRYPPVESVEFVEYFRRFSGGQGGGE